MNISDLQLNFYIFHLFNALALINFHLLPKLELTLNCISCFKRYRMHATTFHICYLPALHGNMFVTAFYYYGSLIFSGEANIKG